MKDEFNFLDVHHMVNELQVLVGARLNKVYQPDGLLLQFHKSGEGKFLLRVSGSVLWLTESKPLMPEKLSGLCAKLRKHITGKKLTKLEQFGSERIVKFVFETQKETYFLIIELFAKGNVILTDENLKILSAFEERSWKDREVRRGKQYELPPQKANLFELTELPKTEKELATLGFGKLLAKEILARGGGVKGYKSLLAEKPSPRKYGEERSPIVLKQFKEAGQPAESFSKLVDEVFGVEREEQVKSEALSKFEKKRQKLLDVIKMQSKTVESLEKKAADAQVIGEAIYEHFQDCQSVLDEVKKKKSAKDVKTGHVTAKSFSAKTGDVQVEIK